MISADILDEYQRVGERLAEGFPGVDLEPILALLVLNSTLVETPEPIESVCEDPDDDKFIACALAGSCEFIISGDRHLLRVHGYRGLSILSLRQFVDRLLPAA